MFPYQYDEKQLASLLSANGLRQVLFNAPVGDWARGDRGLASLPGRESQFKESIALALNYASTLACSRMHVMAGVIPPYADASQMRDVYCENLSWAAQRAADAGIELLIEPINPRDMPGYFLNRQANAHAVVTDVRSRQPEGSNGSLSLPDR